jgi:hypothetical protein
MNKFKKNLQYNFLKLIIFIILNKNIISMMAENYSLGQVLTAFESLKEEK